MEHEQDRLSSLPKIILHEILSRLPRKDAVRTSVLSQTWLDTWNTFPILSFCDTEIIPMEDIVRERNILKFRDYVNKRMLRFCDQNLVIKKFKLNLNRIGLSRISKEVDLWCKLACESGVEIIEYSNHVSVSLEDRQHVFPMCVVEAKSLAKLVLEGNVIISRIEPASSFINHSIKFLSLRELSMSYVLFKDEQTIEHIISWCPLIEYITLNCCYVLSSRPRGGTKKALKSLRMSGLQKLKGVQVYGIQDFFVDAPCLENVSYSPRILYKPCKVYFDGCRNLKRLQILSVMSTFFTKMWFFKLFSKFPFLESLKLNYCAMPKRINISSVGLKVLELLHCSNLEEVNIDAPNLLSCQYYGAHGYSKPNIFFLTSSSQLEVNIKINGVGREDLCNLREFVQNIKPHNVLISLSLVFSLSDVNAWNFVDLQVSSPPPRIKHLHLGLSCIPSDETSFLPVVDILLSSCVPSTISFDIDFNIFSKCRAFIEIFYETLMKRKDDDCYCNSINTKCWWHDLKDVKFTSSAEIDENVDLKTMLELLSNFPNDMGKISFLLVF